MGPSSDNPITVDVLEHEHCGELRAGLSGRAGATGPSGAAGAPGRPVLTYISRRILYSIPVMLIASFLLFVFVRATFDPTARLRRVAPTPAAVAREKERLGLDEPVVVQYGELARERSCAATWGQSERTNARTSSTMIRRALWYTVQLIFWGILLSAIGGDRRGRVLRGQAVLAARLHRSPACRSSASRCRRSGSGSSRSSSSRSAGHDWFDLQQPIFYFVGLHSGDSDGLQPRLPAPPRAAGADADRADHRRVEPLPAGRRCST